MRAVLLTFLLAWTTSGQAPAPAIAVAARALRPGEVALVPITTDTPIATLSASVFGRTFVPTRIAPLRWETLIGIDLDTKPGRHTLLVEGKAGDRLLQASKPLVVTTRQFPTRRLTVDDAFVNPPEEVVARIASEARELEHLWADSVPERLWTGRFMAPVPQAANSAFGTRSIFNGQPRSPHGGADFPSPAGTPVRAPAGGRVVLARDLYYTGGTVVIDHGAGVVSLFAHLSRTDVSNGELIETGHGIGLVGATGRVTGPHLHWSLRVGAARVDPISLLSVLGSPASR